MADSGSAASRQAAGAQSPTTALEDGKPEDFAAGSARADTWVAPPAGGADQVPSRYRVHLLPDAKVTERGVVYRRGDDRFLLVWSRVERALAAEVGEPEGVRTIVFDLALELVGPECVVCRLDAEPGEEASALARAIQIGVGRDRCSASLRALATEGLPTRCYPDLDTLTEANLESIRFQT
jgi:hypothetical protein